MRLTMPATASIRDLRNHFPKVRRMLEDEGEVLLTDKGHAKYRLLRYSEPAPEAPPAVDFWVRLTSAQPQPITADTAHDLHEVNRDDR